MDENEFREKTLPEQELSSDFRYLRATSQSPGMREQSRDLKRKPGDTKTIVEKEVMTDGVMSDETSDLRHVNARTALWRPCRGALRSFDEPWARDSTQTATELLNGFRAPVMAPAYLLV